jgi:hypothetical protein
VSAAPGTPALVATARSKATDSRPYRLAQAEGDAAHADHWDDAALARFQARAAAFQRRGFTEQDADDLAERAHLLEVQAEGRALCLTCRHLAGFVARGWRCGNHRAAGLLLPDVSLDLATMAQRCPGFAPAPGLDARLTEPVSAQTPHRLGLAAQCGAEPIAEPTGNRHGPTH